MPICAGRSGRTRRCGRPPERRKSAVAFLSELLAGGPVKVRDIWERVLKEGRSPHTVRNARKDLGIQARKVTEDGRNVTYWLLYGQRLPDEDKPEGEMDEWERRLKELSEQFPPKTPLEDDDF